MPPLINQVDGVTKGRIPWANFHVYSRSQKRKESIRETLLKVPTAQDQESDPMGQFSRRQSHGATSRSRH